MTAGRARRLLFDARVLGDDGIGRVTRALLPRVMAQAAAHGLEAAVLTRAPLLGVAGSRQVIDASQRYSVEELTAPARAAAELGSDVFLSLDVKIGAVPPRLAVVAVAHDMMRLHRPELCYDDAAVVARWGAAGLAVMRASAAMLGALVPNEGNAGEPVHARYCRLAAYWMVQRADLLVAPSRTSLDHILAAGAAPRRQPRVVQWGLDHLSPPTQRRAAGPRYLAYVGQNRPHKNVAALLAAFALLRDVEPDLELWLVGRDFPDGGTGREAGRDRVRRVGPIDDEALVNLVADAAVLVQPSQEEGFGFGPFEALLAGTPVLLGPAPVFDEHFAGFGPHDVGWARDTLVADIATEARRLLSHGGPSGRARRAARARARFGAMTWGACTDELLRLVAGTEGRR